MNIKFAYTIMYVQDVEKTLVFYVNAFGFEQKMLTPEKDYGELVSGQVTLAFADFTLGKSNFKESFETSSLDKCAFGIELAFTTDDVELSMKSAIDHGALLYEEAMVKPWGQTVGYVRDINGFLIELCSPIVS